MAFWQFLACLMWWWVGVSSEVSVTILNVWWLIRNLLPGLWPFVEHETALLGSLYVMAVSLSGGLIPPAAAPVLKPFSCQRASRSLFLLCCFLNALRTHKPLFAASFFFFLYIYSLMDKCLICLCVRVSVSVAVEIILLQNP